MRRYVANLDLALVGVLLVLCLTLLAMGRSQARSPWTWSPLRP